MPTSRRPLWRARFALLGLLLCIITRVAAADVTIRTERAVQIVPANETNRSPRLPGVLVLHYTHVSLPETLELFSHGTVSSHYTVDRNGDIYQHVDELESAFHAGVSFWQRAKVNHQAIGMEIINTGPLGPCAQWLGDDISALCSGGEAWEVFPEAQMAAVVALAQDILARYPIDPFDVIGHSDVAPIRKQDPGPAFPWLQLARAGVGVAYDAEAGVLVHGDESFALFLPQQRSLADIQTQLRSLGYGVTRNGVMDAITRRVILAFHSHFLGRFDDHLTEESLAVLDALCRWKSLREDARLLEQALDEGI